MEHRRSYWPDVEPRRDSPLAHFRRQSTKSEKFSPLWILHLFAFAAIVNGSPEKRASLEMKTRSPSMKANSARVFYPGHHKADRSDHKHLSHSPSASQPPKRTRPLAYDLFSLRNRGRVMRQRVASRPLVRPHCYPQVDVSKLHRCLFKPAIFMAELDDDHTSRSNKV